MKTNSYLRSRAKSNVKTYSSAIVKALIENKTWSFWSKDWSKRITVQWDPKVALEKFKKHVVELVGEDFIYERALTAEPVKYTATVKGLIPEYQNS